MMVYEVDNNGLKRIRTWSTKYSLTLKDKYSLASRLSTGFESQEVLNTFTPRSGRCHAKGKGAQVR